MGSMAFSFSMDYNSNDSEWHYDNSTPIKVAGSSPDEVNFFKLT
jgi:hypothetical protein